MSAFFTLHRDLPREGPGLPEDVHWALEQITPPKTICDAACGPGADTAVLAQACPQAQITGIDKQAHFIEDARQLCAPYGDRIAFEQGDMAQLPGQYDLIWCAGALYFLGVTEGLQTWRKNMALGGAIAFSEPVLTSATGTAAERSFWDGHVATDLAGIEARVQKAGYRTLASRRIVGDAWRAYYDPKQKRIDMLRGQSPDAELSRILDQAQTEIDTWRENQSDIAYQLLVVTPQ